MKELKSKGINVFIDNKIKRGESVGPVLVGAIRQSRVAVVFLSRNYASSSWCLDELVEIMKCREDDQQTVMTIFYEVDPSDVRKQIGDFGKAFDETCVGKEEKVKQTWRQALNNVAGIAGYHSSNCANEADLINKVASDVRAVLGFTPSKDFDDFVGLGVQIKEIKLKLILQSEEVKVIGILGPAGIGKTTLARVLYNQLSPDFTSSTFLENISGNYEKPCGNNYQLKLRLHQNLLSQLLNQRDINVRHLGVAQEMLSDKKVLVVLDDVDNWWQLEAMGNKLGYFGSGSIITITTEDRKHLKQLRLGVDHIYEMKFPTSAESFEIFCQYAFGQKSPDYGFELLALEVTWLAGNLPLGLRVMGSYIRGMPRDEWVEALPRLRSSLDREIETTLGFSYNGLSDKDKAPFLHIACFFSSFDGTVESVKRCLEKSGLDVNHGLQILADKSLMFIEDGFIKMHSLLQQMGKEIVKKQSLEEPGKRQFLWDADEITDVLEENTGTGKVLGISLYPAEGGKIQISKSAFEGMSNLQFLKVSSCIRTDCSNTLAYELKHWDEGFMHTRGTLCIPEGLDCLPNKLRLLDWHRCPLRIWPSKFSGKFLVELIMQDSSFETLWEGIQPLQCLKLMDLSYSPYLKEIPDLSEATSLEKLELIFCESLLELTSSIGNATKLRICNISTCRLLKKLPFSISRLTNLEELDLSYCSSLKEFSGCSSLKKLDLMCTAIEEMPLSISAWSCLYKLNISRCRNIKEFPNVPDSIVELELSVTEIEEVPPWIEKLSRLRQLLMYGCKKLKNISPNIAKLENLEFLCLRIYGFSEYNDDDEDLYKDTDLFEAIIEWGPELKRSWTLKSDFDVHYILPICLPQKAYTSPISLRITGKCFETIPDCIVCLSGLSKLDVGGCRELVALPPLPDSLLSLDAKGCQSLQRIDSSSFLNPNICLNFADCSNLDQKARNLIETSACKYAFLPGEEVPAHFTHRATSGSLTISLTLTPLPSSFRFKACILLSEVNMYSMGNSIEMARNPMKGVSCRVRGTQNGLTGSMYQISSMWQI